MQPTLEQKTRQGSPSSRVDMLGEVAKLLAENIPAGEAVDKLALTKALHDVLECLGETIWRAQRDTAPPDGMAYLESLRRKLK